MVPLITLFDMLDMHLKNGTLNLYDRVAFRIPLHGWHRIHDFLYIEINRIACESTFGFSFFEHNEKSKNVYLISKHCLKDIINKELL